MIVRAILNAGPRSLARVASTVVPIRWATPRYRLTAREADSAVFAFEQEKLSRGELEGAPATFADAGSARAKPIQGGANKLSYDYVARTLRMSGDAWIHKDQYEIKGCDLIYDFADERVTSGSADCAELFRIRVLSNQNAQAPAAAPPP